MERKYISYLFCAWVYLIYVPLREYKLGWRPTRLGASFKPGCLLEP